MKNNKDIIIVFLTFIATLCLAIVLTTENQTLKLITGITSAAIYILLQFI